MKKLSTIFIILVLISCSDKSDKSNKSEADKLVAQKTDLFTNYLVDWSDSGVTIKECKEREDELTDASSCTVAGTAELTEGQVRNLILSAYISELPDQKLPTDRLAHIEKVQGLMSQLANSRVVSIKTSTGRQENESTLRLFFRSLQRPLRVVSVLKAHDRSLAILEDGTPVTLGRSNKSTSDVDDPLEQHLFGALEIYSNEKASAALKSDGSVVTWGDAYYGGDSSKVKELIQSGVKSISNTEGAFAALKHDGSIVTWGAYKYGGDSSGIRGEITPRVFKSIVATKRAFAAITVHGTLVAWGSSNFGGHMYGSRRQRQGVKAIYSTKFSFAALKEDGSVVVWSDSYNPDTSHKAVTEHIQSNVKEIFSTTLAFAALKDDGSVITWGEQSYGGYSPGIKDRLESGVRSVISNQESFAALKNDGSVVFWGSFKGTVTTIGEQQGFYDERLKSGVKSVWANTSGFVAIKEDGAVITVGERYLVEDFKKVEEQLSSGVKAVIPSYVAYAALKYDGSVITWGHSKYGGDSGEVQEQLESGVETIFEANGLFLAVKSDGWLVEWGESVTENSKRGATELIEEKNGALLKKD